LIIRRRAAGRLLKRHGAGIWLALILPLAIWFGYRQRDDLAKTWDLVVNASPLWIAGVLALEVVSFVLMAAVYGLVLRHMGHIVRVKTLIDIHLQRIVIGALTPMGGASSVALFVHRLRQRGIKPSTSLVAATIKSVVGHVAFLLLLLPALGMQEPSALMTVSAICVVLAVISMVTLLTFVLSGKKPPAFILKRLPRRGLRFLAQIRQHKISYRALIVPFLYSIGIKGSGVLTLYFCLKAVGFAGGFQVALIAYVIGVIFGVMTPMFQGVGVGRGGDGGRVGSDGRAGPGGGGSDIAVADPGRLGAAGDRNSGADRAGDRGATAVEGGDGDGLGIVPYRSPPKGNFCHSERGWKPSGGSCSPKIVLAISHRWRSPGAYSVGPCQRT